MHRVVARAGHEEAAIRCHHHFIRPHAHAQVTQLFAALGIHHAHRARTPVAHIEMPFVRTKHAGVGICPNLNFALQRQRRSIQYPHLLVGLVAHIQPARFRMHRDACHEAWVTLLAHLHRRGGGELAVRVIKHVDLPRSSAAHKQPLPLGIKSQTVPGVRQFDELPGRLCRHIHDSQSWIVKARTHRQRHLAIRCHNHFQRHIPFQRRMLARRRDAPAVEHQALAWQLQGGRHVLCDQSRGQQKQK